MEFVQWQESGDHLWLRWWVRCQHWKKSERLVELPCAASTRFREGKLVECHNYQDFMHLFSQLELVPEQAFEYGLAGADLLEAEERKREALPPSAKGQTHFLWPGVRKVKTGGRELYLPCSSRQLLSLEQESDCHRLRLMRGRTILWAQVAVARVPSSSGGSRIVRAVQEGSRLEELVEFQETERKMLSMELHDGLAQELATLWIYLQTGKHKMEPTPVLMERCLRVVESLSEELRRRKKELRSPILEGVSLTQALETLVARVSREHSLDITIALESEVDLVDHTVSLLVYRVVQEALRNVVAHAKASRCQIVLHREGEVLKGSIVDDGCGFDHVQAALKGRLGIIGMRERCELVGGKLKIESKLGLGTSIHFEVRGVTRAEDGLSRKTYPFGAPPSRR